MIEIELEEDYIFYINFSIKYRILFGEPAYLVNDEKKYYCKLCNELILIETPDEFDNLELRSENTAKIGKHFRIHSDKIEKLLVFK